jgi:hypothetical protein
VNPFDWRRAFPQVFARGGFDAVIGNPPYVRQESLGNDKKYFKNHYQVYAGTADLYSYFIEKGVFLLAPDGLFCYIVANKWMRANYGEALRKWLKTKCIEEITDFGDLPVFENATTYPCILRISNRKPHFSPNVTQVKTLEFTSLHEYVEANGNRLDQSKFSDDGWSLANTEIQTVFEKLNTNSIPLSQYVDGKIYRGILTGLNEAFVIDAQTRERLISEDPKSAQIIKPFLIGRDIKRYQPPESLRFLILMPKGWTKQKSGNSNNAWKWLQQNYPSISKYLEPFSSAAIKRFDKGDYWWELRACDYYAEFEKPKIVYPNICKRPEFTVDTNNFYSNQKSFIISIHDLYLLGILNSKIMMFFFKTTIPKLRGDFYEPGYVFMKDFPVHSIISTNHVELLLHERMIILVERMLELHRRLPSPPSPLPRTGEGGNGLGNIKVANTPQEQERVKREIESTDRQIDKLVYELYGLTEKEIKIVESS